MSRQSISQRTLKVLFARSLNRCAYPGCTESIVDPVTEVVNGEVCHIEGVEPKSARYNPNQDRNAINDSSNLILLCSKHHKLIDEHPETYTVSWLRQRKEQLESQGRCELEPSDTRFVEVMLMKRDGLATEVRKYNNSNHFEATGSATQNITITNNIKVRGCKRMPASVPVTGTIGSDAEKGSYAKYLYGRLVEFKAAIPGYNPKKAGIIVANRIRKIFGTTVTHIPISRYEALVAHLMSEIDKTPIGRMQRTKGNKRYDSFEEFMSR